MQFYLLWRAVTENPRASCPIVSDLPAVHQELVQSVISAAVIVPDRKQHRQGRGSLGLRWQVTVPSKGKSSSHCTHSQGQREREAPTTPAGSHPVSSHHSQAFQGPAQRAVLPLNNQYSPQAHVIQTTSQQSLFPGGVRLCQLTVFFKS